MYTLYWSADSGAFSRAGGVGGAWRSLSTRDRRHLARRPPPTRIPRPQPHGAGANVAAARWHDHHRIGGDDRPPLRRASRARAAAGTGNIGARAVAYRWLFWLATGLYESDLRYYYPDRYTAEPGCAEAVQCSGAGSDGSASRPGRGPARRRSLCSRARASPRSISICSCWPLASCPPGDPRAASARWAR